jgi:hypothetical protein
MCLSTKIRRLPLAIRGRRIPGLRNSKDGCFVQTLEVGIDKMNALITTQETNNMVLEYEECMSLSKTE